MSSLHEECGVFGIYSRKQSDIAKSVYYGLYALQHRGQESAGIVICDDGLFYTHKDLGLVGDVFSKDTLDKLPAGSMAIGHVRYSTTGGNVRENCQPIVVNHQKGRLAVAHNGNLSNAFELRSELEMKGAIFHSTSDTETISYIVTQERIKHPSIEEAVSFAMDRLEGAYSLILMSATKMIALRDAHGLRPLCYGKMDDDTYVIASESCALEAVGAEFVRDIKPGEIVTFDSNGVHSNTHHCGSKEVRHCIFEYLYFARPDSVIDGVSVHKARIMAGKIPAEKCPVDADLVIGVPDSGLDAALGYSYYSGIPYAIGLIKNKYIGRTFISPESDERSNLVKIKLNAIREVLDGKRIILIDDSIVRGTTSAKLVSLLREAGAKEVHMMSSAPEFLNPCYYGTDIDSRENLIAANHTLEEIRDIIGVDSLHYLPLEDLKRLIGSSSYCVACFSGDYPTRFAVTNR
ncbi:MAG: amidophosphoribosyltransferase [Clostridia bacterium]|nr:amidophosphoribosyltransferase [Clostridia bacterium]